MKIFVKAKPNSKREKIEQVSPSSPTLWGEKSETSFAVAVKEPPRDGKANEAIVKVLARHFGIPRSRVRLVSGFSSKKKVFEIV
ncbi:MAG: DUF167 domain-containing protein [Candidatus Liptonbacteria bacterium]|nr:DUF167 domain-containing protein [Candidatus Liptonbacteria bacterium]